MQPIEIYVTALGIVCMEGLVMQPISCQHWDEIQKLWYLEKGRFSFLSDKLSINVVREVEGHISWENRSWGTIRVSVHANGFQPIVLGKAVLLFICVRWHWMTPNKSELKYIERELISQALNYELNVKHTKWKEIHNFVKMTSVALFVC